MDPPGEPHIKEHLTVQHCRLGVCIGAKGVADIAVQPKAVVSVGEVLYPAAHLADLGPVGHHIVGLETALIGIVAGSEDQLEVVRGVVLQPSVSE